MKSSFSVSPAARWIGVIVTLVVLGVNVMQASSAQPSIEPTSPALQPSGNAVVRSIPEASPFILLVSALGTLALFRKRSS